MKYMGIDPGAKGGFAVIDDSGKLIDYWRNSDKLHEIESLIVKHLPYTAVALEKATTMGYVQHGRRQSISSMFSYGVGYGKLLALLTLSNVEFYEVEAVSWQAVILGSNKGDTKSRVIQKCKKWHPEETFIPKGCRVIHEGVTDAVALAHFAMERDNVL